MDGVVGVAKELFAMRGRGAERRQARRRMLVDAMGKLELRAVLALDRGPATSPASNLVRHADRAVQRRP